MIETALMRVLRGSGPAGLSAMQIFKDKEKKAIKEQMDLIENQAIQIKNRIKPTIENIKKQVHALEHRLSILNVELKKP